MVIITKGLLVVLLLLQPLFGSRNIAIADDDDLDYLSYDYPTADPPPPGMFFGSSKPCPTCPWNRAELGPYPKPFNAQNTQFEPIHRGQYFDVYGHWMETRYSQVFWTAQPAVSLPQEIRDKFQGRAILITGYETDVVSGGLLSPEEPEFSVPEFEVYNHHYNLILTGKDVKMTRIGTRRQDSLLKSPEINGTMIRTRTGRHAIEVHPSEWEPRDIMSGGKMIPTAQFLVQGNGGEHRKSFKHLPRGTGHLLLSPDKLNLNPMFINTKFPAQKGQSPRQAFRNATRPRTSLSPPNADYSGLMECPCTTRTHKLITGFETCNQGTCGDDKDKVKDQEECFMAAAQLMPGGILNNITLKSTKFPSPCYLVASSKGTEAYFNTQKKSNVPCGTQEGVPIRSIGQSGVISNDNATSKIAIQLELDQASDSATITITAPADKWFGIGFDAAGMVDTPYTIVVEPDAQGGSGITVTERVLGNHEPGTPLESSVTIQSNTVGPVPPPPPLQMTHRGSPIRQEDVGVGSWQACRELCRDNPECEAWTYLPGTRSFEAPLQDGACRLRHDDASTPDNSDGFTSDGWSDGMWSGVIAGNSDDDDKLVRKVVLTRPLKGATHNHYTFDPTIASLPYIEAVGGTRQFGYHGPNGRGGGVMIMVETGAPVCICRTGKLSGSINGIPWSDNCHDYPDTTIKRDNNPSCSIDTYQGGMICCHHDIFLLDADQEIPAPTFKFRMKFRFWYEDPEETTVGAVDSTVGPSISQIVYPGLDYQNAFFFFRETEIAHGEYDVPACAEGTPVEACVHTVIGTFQVKDGLHECQGRADVYCAMPPVANQTFPFSQHIALVHISAHCHGPACISMEMINEDTNETICYTEPHYGVSDMPMDEAGYAAGIPPCIWGTPEEGLPFPPILNLKTNITVIKKVNSTVGHRGVMGHWQMRAIWAADPSKDAKDKIDDEEATAK
mmetsp:Transcript_472/g.736  ORF Transcript_472/g.736 Transcript_472/m.736 type:complete len:955 (+) Transcript_472:147-3011(+)